MKLSCCSVFAIAAFVTFTAFGCDGAELKEIKKFRTKIFYAFIVTNQDMNAMDSYAACAKKNLTMASIDSQEENDAIGGFLRNRVRNREESVRGWLGGSDTGRENRWYWMHSEKAFTFENWAPGHPKKSSDQNCMYMGPPKEDRNGLWYSTFCVDVYQGLPICQELI